MQTFFWLVHQLFNVRKSEQERIEWHWFWHIEVPAWWGDLWVVKSAQQGVHWTRAALRLNEQSPDDDIPF